MTAVQLQHKKNKDVLVRAGFTITNYKNTAYKQILYAVHKDGRRVAVSV